MKKKMFINYRFNTCKEIYETMDEAINNALEDKDAEGDYIYVNHYIDTDENLDGWGAYIAPDGDMNGTRYISINEYKEEGCTTTGYWEDEWDTPDDIAIILEDA